MRKRDLMWINRGSGGGGGSVALQDKTITENGTYTADEGYSGLGNVTVDVQSSGGSNDALIALISGTENVVIPNGTTEIKSYLFYKDEIIKSVSLPEGITEIKAFTFDSAKNLESCNLPDSITMIDDRAFYYTNLSATKLPKNLYRAGARAFYNNGNLAFSELPPNIVYISEYAFYSCKKCSFSKVPTTVKSIGNQAFYYFSLLTEVTFEGKPDSISSAAFQQCTNLLTINVPWAEGEVANAPWGATNATINYNYTGE